MKMRRIERCERREGDYDAKRISGVVRRWRGNESYRRATLISWIDCSIMGTGDRANIRSIL
jgi:hypothetical protein